MEKVPIVCTQFSSEHINSEMHYNSNTNLDGFTKDRAGVMERLYKSQLNL